MILIITEILKLKKAWKLQDAIRVSEEYLQDNPYDKDIVLELTDACWHIAEHDKVIKYGKMLLDNNDYPNRAKNMLIHSYARINKLDEARELVKSNSLCHNSYEKLMLKNHLYESDREKQNYVKRLLWSSFNDMLYTIELIADVKYNGIMVGESKFTYAERITLMEKALGLYKLMYEDEDYYSEAIMVMDIHIALALLNLRNQNKDKCYYHLDQALKLCIYFETYNESKHSSILVRDDEVEAKIRWSKGAVLSMLEDLESDLFIEIKAEDRFNQLILYIKNIKK